MAEYNADEFFGRKPFTMCRDCVYPEKRANGLYCAKSNVHIAGIGGCRDGKEKPPTNGDAIRAMSEEELVATFTEFYDGDMVFSCPVLTQETEGRCAGNRECGKCFLDWLKSKAEETE